MPEIIEYRVRPVTRYMVTRYYESADGQMAGCCSLGEFENVGAADRVALALQQTEKGSTYTTLTEGNTAVTHPADMADAIAAQVLRR